MCSPTALCFVLLTKPLSSNEWSLQCYDSLDLFFESYSFCQLLLGLYFICSSCGPLWLFFLCVLCQHLLRLLLSLSQIIVYYCSIWLLCKISLFFAEGYYILQAELYNAFSHVSVSFFRNQQCIFKRLIHRNPKITNPKNTESHWVCSSRHTFFPPRWPNKVALLKGRPTGSCGYWICEG